MKESGSTRKTMELLSRLSTNSFLRPFTTVFSSVLRTSSTKSSRGRERPHGDTVRSQRGLSDITVKHYEGRSVERGSSR